MKKQLNSDPIANELRGNSAFFPRYKEEPVTAPVTEQTPRPPTQATVPTSRPVPPVRVVPPVPLVRDVPPTKRIMKQRWPIDIYQDQYESLQQLALEERKQGGIGSMSAMVRQALDRLIAEKKQGKK